MSKNLYDNLVNAILQGNVVRATKYLTPKSVVKATRKRYDGKFLRGNVEIILTIGKPNYAERAFIKQCVKAGEPFPVKKIQLKLNKV